MLHLWGHHSDPGIREHANRGFQRGESRRVDAVVVGEKEMHLRSCARVRGRSSLKVVISLRERWAANHLAEREDYFNYSWPAPAQRSASRSGESARVRRGASAAAWGSA